MGLGGGGGGNTTTTQKSDPWSGQQGYLTDIFNRAQQFGTNPSQAPQYYPNSTVAAFNPQETNSLNSTYNYGMNGGSQSLQNADSTMANILSPDYLSQQNPYQDQINQNIMASVMPSLTAQFTQGGGTNNPNTAYAVSQGVGNAIANSEYGQYQQNQQNQLKAGLEAPQINQSQLGNLQAAQGAGSAFQQQSQNELSDQVNRYNYNQQLPENQLNYYANLVNGQYGGTTSTTSPYYQNPLASAASGLGSLGTIANAGSSMYNALPSWAAISSIFA